MSMQERINIECEECGKEYEFTWHCSINVSLDPELKEKVISGENFKTKCPHCRKTSYMLFPFLYHDMVHKFMIYVDSKEKVNERLNEHKKAQEEMAKQFPNLPKTNIESATFENYQYIETIINAYENDLDMLYVDLYLALSVKQMEEAFKDVEDFNGIYDCFLNMIDDELRVVYVLNENGSGFNQLFDKELYDSIKKDFQS